MACGERLVLFACPKVKEWLLASCETGRNGGWWRVVRNGCQGRRVSG